MDQWITDRKRNASLRRTNTFYTYTPAGRKNLTEHRYMCSEDVRKYRRIGILQVDQTVTRDSLDLKYVHDAIGTCIQHSGSSLLQSTYLISLQITSDNIQR